MKNKLHPLAAGRKKLVAAADTFRRAAAATSLM
jgi:hypothetical protein